jgi:hypothetical protein
MANPNLESLEGRDANLVPYEEKNPLTEQLVIETDTRLFSVQTAFEDGWSDDEVHKLTKIDKWFLC